MENQIITQFNDGVYEIILNNPQKLNCMGFQMLRELADAVNEASNNPSIKVIVFKGAGDRSFSTGANLKEYQTLNEEESVQWIEVGNDVFNSIETLSKPTIAFIHGFAMGGGLELALACDFRVGTRSAVLSSPELQHGWLPGWGGIVRLRRLIGESRAKEVVLLNERLPAKEAYRLGILSKIDDDGTILDSLIFHLKSIKGDAFAMAKSVLHDPKRTTFGKDVHFGE